MKITKLTKANRSTISFYNIKHRNAEKFNFKKAWLKVINGDFETRYCTNICSCEVSASDLLEKLHFTNEFDEELWDLVTNEHSNGANYMFIFSNRKGPIEGFYIELVLDQVH